MVAFFKKKPDLVLGIDIRPTSVSILAVSYNHGLYCVEGYGRTTFSHHLNNIDTIAASIKTLISRTNLSSKQVVLAVPDSSTMSKTIQISAHVNERDIEEWVMMEIEKCIPYSLDDIHFDFNIIGPSSHNPARLDVRVVLSRAENVDQRVEMIRRAGLVVQIVDVESFAIERVARTWLINALNVALFDIDDVSIRCFVFNGDSIIFSREDTLSDKPGLSDLLQKIKGALQFFSGSIAQIMLAGGMAELQNLEQVLQVHLGIPIQIVNPFIRMTFTTTELRERIEQDASMLMVACGLALRR